MLAFAGRRKSGNWTDDAPIFPRTRQGPGRRSVTSKAPEAALASVPLSSGDLKGFDALLSTVNMPPGIPVATFGIGKAGCKNAALFAAAILAMNDPAIRERLAKFREAQSAAVPERPE